MKRKVVVQYIRFKNSPESILMKLVRGLIAFKASLCLMIIIIIMIIMLTLQLSVSMLSKPTEVKERDPVAQV